MTNIIRAIINLTINSSISNTISRKETHNKMNFMGDNLEEFMKELFTNGFKLDEVSKNKKYNEYFSYLGNQNNPPDLIIKGGDAIEVKKIESCGNALALNSSYPKHKLLSNSLMINKACRHCEEWIEKDIIYSVGVINKNTKQLTDLWMVYGEDYAASIEVYEKIKLKIKEGILTIPAIEFGDTKELGRVNKVDPLGITNLRIRGMWTIENPATVFSYVYSRKKESAFSFFAIINQEKYNSFPTDDLKELENLSINNDNLTIEEIEIKNPDNPALLRKAKIIIYNKGKENEL